ncbi:MAG: hypothetical protein R3E85_07580 [Planctomycetota bacterium]
MTATRRNASGLLEEQVTFRLDHAGLREAQAAAWFLAGDTTPAPR